MENSNFEYASAFADNLKAFYKFNEMDDKKQKEFLLKLSRIKDSDEVKRKINELLEQ